MQGIRTALRMVMGACGIGLAVAACTPRMPPPAEDGYVLLPRSISARLEDPAVVAGEWQGALSGMQRATLRRLLAQARKVAARNSDIVVGGYLTAAQRSAIVAEAAAFLPTARVRFTATETITPVVWVHYAEVMPRRCMNGDGWHDEDGLPPSGCSVALTLGRMVANPNDLVDAQAMGPALLAPLARDAIRYADEGGKDVTAPTATPPAQTMPMGTAAQ